MSDQPDDFNLDPTDPHAYTRERAEHLRKQDRKKRELVYGRQ